LLPVDGFVLKTVIPSEYGPTMTLVAVSAGNHLGTTLSVAVGAKAFTDFPFPAHFNPTKDITISPAYAILCAFSRFVTRVIPTIMFNPSHTTETIRDGI
jgi:hypothetical protein